MSAHINNNKKREHKQMSGCPAGQKPGQTDRIRPNRSPAGGSKWPDRSGTGLLSWKTETSVRVTGRRIRAPHKLTRPKCI